MSGTKGYNHPGPPNEEPFEPRLTVLDPEGDGTLVITRGNEAQKFIKCCSRVLTLASPVFAKKLSAHALKEAKRQDHVCPMVELEEEYPNAMVQVLCLLHHSDPLKFEAKPHDIAAVAVQSHKYECQKALQAWGESVCRQHSDRGITDTAEIGCLMLAGFLFDLPTLKAILIEGLKNLKPGFQEEWGKHAIMRHFSTDITDWLGSRVCKNLLELQGKIYVMEGRVRGNRSPWPLLSSRSGKKYCRLCGKVHPRLATYCACCEKTDLTKACPRESRSAAYLNNLEAVGLWPSPMIFLTFSAVQLLGKLRYLSDLPSPHGPDCRAGSACGVRVAHDGLYNICKMHVDDLIVPAGALGSRKSGSQ